jgi:hypothetical protein
VLAFLRRAENLCDRMSTFRVIQLLGALLAVTGESAISSLSNRSVKPNLKTSHSHWREAHGGNSPLLTSIFFGDHAEYLCLAKMSMVFKIQALRAIRSAASHQGTRPLRSLR